MKGLFTLSKENLWSALVYGIIMFLLSFISYISKLDLTPETLGTLGIISSILKNLLTTTKGNFGGVVPVIPEIK